jgi:hypothetical protein
MGLANGIPVYYTGLGNQDVKSVSNWIDLANTLHGLDDSELPKVMTTSYGFGETGASDQFLQYVDRCSCLCLRTKSQYQGPLQCVRGSRRSRRLHPVRSWCIGLRCPLQHVSYRFASGDSGPGGNNDCTQFSPGFPGTCPFVREICHARSAACLIYHR